MNLRGRGMSKPKQLQEICLTPLIDTALTLLVIFMVATPIMNNGLAIDLPKSKTDENSQKNNPLTIYLEKSIDGDLGMVFIDDMSVEFKDLIPCLQDKLGSLRHQTVNLNADQSLPYKVIVDVVDKVKFVPGVDHVILSTARAS